MNINEFKISYDGAVDYITWDELRRVMGVEEYEKFGEWIKDQTISLNGAYVSDVERWLNKDKPFDFTNLDELRRVMKMDLELQSLKNKINERRG